MAFVKGSGQATTPPKGTTFSVTVTFDANLETTFTDVISVVHEKEVFDLLQSDGTWTHVPSGYAYLQISEVEKE